MKMRRMAACPPFAAPTLAISLQSDAHALGTRVRVLARPASESYELPLFRAIPRNARCLSAKD
ncbi:hypothetical protein RKE25_05660 [Dyella sp. BiH032]|uniref:hypothetical protein n=1 Tax=Dyella sp. BiH032 TaxID=3075430 RepID=UPI0028932B32|nr:hypothetical protein [Dyella sp. BiH032]WNL47121.1 hypothetical protein RKE25_05660 [Dyella sp. BiH032]